MRSLARWAGLIGLVTLLSLGACDSPKEQEAKYVSHGKELYESGDLVKAALEFKNALQINPAGIEAQYYLGLIAEKNHDLNAAGAAFQRVAQEDPHHFEAHLKAGQFALMSGSVDAASNYARELIEMAPDKPEGHTMMAAVYMLQNRLDLAEKEANAALKLDPKNVDAIAVLAGSKGRAGKYDEALSLVETGLSTDPKNRDLLLVKLRMMYDQKRSDEVIKVLQQLHAVDPGNISYTIDLGNQLARAGRVDESQTVFKTAIDANQTSDELVGAYATFLIATKTLDQAIIEIKKLADEAHQAPKYVLLLEQLYLKAERFDDATALMENLRSNASAADDRLQARVELARITLLKGNKQDALDQLNAVINEDAANEGALLLRASIMITDLKFDSAISDARAILHKNLNSVGGLTILAKAYEATGERDLAVDTLRSLVRIAPDNVDARLQLATLLSSKSPEDALQNLDAAIALRPDATELKVEKAEYLIRTGSADKAEVIGRELLDDPKLSGAGHRIIGEAAIARSDFQNAITELATAEGQGEPFSRVGPLMVYAYNKVGKAEEAGKILTDRMAKDPQDTTAITLLADLRADSGQYGDAEELLNRAISIQPENGQNYLKLAQILTKQHKVKEAVDIAGKAASKFPNDRNIALFAAVSSDTAGDFPAAKAGYERILAKWPNDLVAANNLAALIADASPGDSAELDRARQLAERFRNSGDAVVLDTLGWVLVRQGHYDDATVILEKATSLAPDNQQLQFHYAVALKSKGLTAKAKEAFAKALAGGPDYRGVDEAKQQLSQLN